ncbi:MAG: restriction endonuclease subunit S, partial [Acidobacteriota bacterium]
MHAEHLSHNLSELLVQRTEKVVGNKDGSMPYVGLEHLITGSPDLLGTASSDFSISTNNVFDRDDVLFGKLRPNLRKCVLAPFSGYCSTDILVLRPRVGTDPAFAANVMKSEHVFREAVATAVGTKMPRTSWNAIRELEIFMPPLPEQHRIAEILDTADEAIRRTEQVIAKLQQMKQGLLHDLLTRGIDDNGNLRDPERHPEQFKDSPLGRIPRGWMVPRLRDLIRRVGGLTQTGPFGSQLHAREYVEVGVPVVMPQDIKGDAIDLTNIA